MPSRLVLCVIVVCASFLSASAAWSQAISDPFSILGIDVDATDASANAAKDQAIADGQRQAFQRLLERLVNAKDRGRIPKVDGADYVADYTIESEHTSKVRYIATLDVRFNAAAVRKLLKGAGVVMIEPIARPVVVVPVLRSAGQTVISDADNPWRSAWLTHGKGGLLTVIVPSSADMGALDADAVAAGDGDAVTPLGTRYHTGEVLTITADLAGDGHKAEVTATGVKGSSLFIEPQTFIAKPGESVDQFLVRSVVECVRIIEAQARQSADLAEAAPGNMLSVIVPVSGLEEWIGIRDRLSRVAMVRTWELVSLTRTEAAVILHLASDQEKARAAFANVGLDMQFGDGYWLLKSASAKR